MTLPRKIAHNSRNARKRHLPRFDISELKCAQTQINYRFFHWFLNSLAASKNI